MTEAAPRPKRAYRKRPPRVAYTLTLGFGIELDVKESANGWWMDRHTMDKLLYAFTLDCNITQACLFAGISLREYRYFVSLHPDFDEGRQGLQLEPSVRAHIKIVEEIPNNFKAARWYLERKHPEEFGSPSRRRAAEQQALAREQLSPSEEEFDEADHPAVIAVNKKYNEEMRLALAQVRRDKEEQKRRKLAPWQPFIQGVDLKTRKVIVPTPYVPSKLKEKVWVEARSGFTEEERRFYLNFTDQTLMAKKKNFKGTEDEWIRIVKNRLKYTYGLEN